MARPMTELLEEVSREHFPSPPATAAEIAEFEERVGWRLDSELRAFYLHCNGAELIKRGPDCPYRILPLSKIVRARVAIFGRDEDKHGPASVYAICNVQDGDHVVIDVRQQVDGRYPLSDAWHEAWPDPSYSEKIEDSFSDFLEAALRARRPSYWMKR
jgi:cell wall assembly regulator SMI1